MTNIGTEALRYFDTGTWCKHHLGARGDGIPRCVGASLNLALSDGRYVAWQATDTAQATYARVAVIIAEQFPDRVPDLLGSHVPGADTRTPLDIRGRAVIEIVNDDPATTREDMRLCLEKLAADGDDG